MPIALTAEHGMPPKAMKLSCESELRGMNALKSCLEQLLHPNWKNLKKKRLGHGSATFREWCVC